MDEPFHITMSQYIKLEQYHFNLVMFTVTPEYVALTDERKADLLNEIMYMGIVNSTLAQVLIPRVTNRRRIMAWTLTENESEYNVLFEFSCIEAASLILNIVEHHIVLSCKGLSKYSSIKGYRFSYKDEFNLIVKTCKF